MSRPDAPARLKRRAEFLAVGRGIRVHAPAFTLQAARRAPAASPARPARRVPEAVPAAPARFGLTVTRKTGTATERNRIRRRLREGLRHAKALSTEPETDYVVVARRDVLSLPFDRLVAELEGVVRRAGAKLRQPRAPRPAAARPQAG